MSLVNFICPDGGKIPVEKCLKPGGCRMAERCATRPYLMMACSERPQRFRCKNGHEFKYPASNKIFNRKCQIPINGKPCNEPLIYVPSTTQLIQGTKAAFLKLTTDYDISPDSRAFMITGSKGHANLEAHDDDYSLIEQRFDNEDISGIADLLTIEDGETVLSDYKVSGSFKVAKALGFATEEEGTGEFYKSGKRKGEEKTRKIIRKDITKRDIYEWQLQLNKYRINFERAGFKVDRLKIQCVVRDGNTYIARQRGVFRNVYYFDIPILDDDVVLGYFDKKKADLLQALKQGHWEEVCDDKECWSGVKCAAYCECADSCPLGKYLKKERNKEVEIMPIKGLSETKRLPRMGKIRLGIMVEKPGKKPYPKEVNYFILDPAVANPEEKKRLIDMFHQKYGTEPTSIDVMFPPTDQGLEDVFPQYYKSYGKTTMLKCKGDGSIAETNDPDYIKNLKNIGEGDFGTKVECKGRECPYFLDKKCSAVGTLSVLLPELPGSGVWQITTGSIHSIINLNSCFEHLIQLGGRYHMIPLKLERREQPIAHDGKKVNHYILHINLDFSIAELQKRAMIDPIKAAMQLPPIAEEAKDLYLEHNETVNPDEEPIEEQVQDAEFKEDPPATQAKTPPEPVGTPAEQDNTTDAGTQKTPQGWDDEPWPEQEELGKRIEADIQTCEKIDQLQAVQKKYNAHFNKDSNDLTVKQRQDLNALIKRRATELNQAK